MVSIPGTTITLEALSRQVAAQLGVTRSDCVAVCSAFVDVLVDEILNGNRVVVTGLGVFQLTPQTLWEQNDGILSRNPTMQVLKPKFVFCQDLRTRRYNVSDGMPYVKSQ